MQLTISRLWILFFIWIILDCTTWITVLTVKHGGGGGGHGEQRQHSSINGNLQVNKCPFLNTETQIKMYNIVGHCHMFVVHVFDEGRGC